MLLLILCNLVWGLKCIQIYIVKCNEWINLCLTFGQMETTSVNSKAAHRIIAKVVLFNCLNLFLCELVTNINKYFISAILKVALCAIFIVKIGLSLLYISKDCHK